jgi:uncharacterized membrane protein
VERIVLLDGITHPPVVNCEARRMGPVKERSDLPGVDRLLTLSDGVVAIALTLLVLQLHVPSIHDEGSARSLADELGHQASSFEAYLISFYVIAQFWLGHHRVFRHVAGHDEGLAWLNFLFLLTISFMPFSSDLLGTYGHNPLAVSIFSLNLLMASISTQLVLAVGRRRHLLLTSAQGPEVREGRFRVLVVIVVAGLSLAVAWVSTVAAQFLWLGFLVAPRLGRSLAKATAPRT